MNADARCAGRKKLDDEAEMLKAAETPQRKPSLIVVLNVRAAVDMGQWCKV